MNARFAGQVLFATGAASGIAWQVALRFTQDGGRVAVVDLDEERARDAAAGLDGALGLGADVAVEQDVRRAVEAALAHFGRIDCVLNAAGYADFGPIEEYSYERWQRMLAVHAGGTFLVCKHTMRALRRDGGAIVNIASTAAIEAQPDNFAYGAAKGAIVAFGRQLAGDVAADGVRVNTVAPGRTRSGITEPLYARRGDGDYAKGAQLSARGIMQRRIAEPVEIANLITFLLSAEASFVTAGLYVADGGETLVLKPDVVVIGAGVAGLVCASLLAAQGKRVTLLEKNGHLGGRAMERRYRGHQLGLGSHLVEDPGDSLTRVCEQIGVTLTHSERSDSMPFWNDGRWQRIQDHYGPGGKNDLKRCIDALLALDYSDLDTLDHLSLREWMARYTDAEGVYLVWEAISVLEQITTKWWEHSASENLYTRKLHYSTKRTAGYSFWPMGGWDKLWHEMADAFVALGGELRYRSDVTRVVVDNGRVRGVELRASRGGDATEVVETDEVVVSAPVWTLPRLFDDGVLPWDLLGRIRYLADNRNRACWLGYWIAATEPVIAMTEREMASFLSTPRCGLPGFTLNFTGYDPGVSPDGEYLTCVGASFDATQHYGDKAWYDRKFAELWDDIEEMLPAARGALWTKPHTVTTYGVICKPGMVGAARPDVRVRGVDGLWLTGDTVRARGIGIDKAARAAISTAEAVLGRRLPAFEGTVRY